MALGTEVMRVTGWLKPGEVRGARVEVFTVTEAQVRFAELRGAISGSGRGYTPPGEYTRLVVDGTLWMSDTSDELRDMTYALRRARGRVLVNGLGLGCFVKGLLAKGDVTSVDVVEVDDRVIELVGSQFTDPHVRVIHGDAYTYPWPVGARWDFAWHDVWPTICSDNTKGIARLKRRFGRRVGEQAAWAEGLVRYNKRRGM